MKIIDLFKKEDIKVGARYELVTDLLGGRLQKGEVFEVVRYEDGEIWLRNYQGEGSFNKKELKKYFKLVEEKNQDSEYIVNEDNDEKIEPEESSNEVDNEDIKENNSTEEDIKCQEDISDYEEISWDEEE